MKGAITLSALLAGFVASLFGAPLVQEPLLGSQPAINTFAGGTGTTSPSGILYGDETIRLKTVGIGSGLSFSGGTLSATGNGASTTLLADSNTFSGNNTFSNIITGAITGNAGSATVLQNSRNINGTAFNGSADITITAASSTLLADRNTFSNTGTTTFSGPIDTGLSNHITTHGVRSDASDGLHVHANNWTDIANFGLGNTANALFYGAVNIDGATRLATSLTGPLQAISGAVTASSSLSDAYISDTLTIGSSGSVADAALSANVSLLGQTIGATELASTDFGSFTCNGTTCAIDSSAVSNTMLANSSLTVNGTAISLGSSGTITAASSTLLSDNNTFANTITGSITGNAGTATALAANGGNCTAGNYPLGVDASGAVETCTADANTTYTAGDALTLTGTDIDFDGGTAPGGSLGGTWASPTIDDLFILNTGDTGTGGFTFDYASTTGISTAYASSTLYYGAGLADCNTENMLTWTAGRFGCESDSTGAGGAFPFTANTNYGAVSNSTSTPIWFTAGLQASSTSYFENSSTTLASVLSTLWVGTGGASDSEIEFGPASNEWTLGYDATDKTFAIASSTTLGTTNAFTIDKNLKITAGGALTVTGATTLATSLSGVLIAASGVVSAGVDGIDFTLVNAVSCTNQFMSALTAAGAGTCASINNAQWSGTDLSVANGGTGLSTFGGSNTLLYTTTADNLASEAALTYNASTDLLTTLYATTTALSASAALYGPSLAACPSTSATGFTSYCFDTTVKQIQITNGANVYAISATTTPSMRLASTTIDDAGLRFSNATSTYTLRHSNAPLTLLGWYCDVFPSGTAHVRFGDGTNYTNMAACTSTGAYTVATTNNTFTSFEPFVLQASSTAGTASVIVLTPHFQQTVQ